MSAPVEIRPEHERRADFVARVAHELRTPLTAVHGALALIAGETEAAEGAGAGGAGTASPELVQMARRNTTRLLRLVEDCLDLHAALDGTLQLARTPVAPAAVLELAVADAERHRHGDVPIDQRCEAQLRVDADALRLARALAHLVDNACSFAPPGSSVVVGARDDLARFRVRFTVEDRGVGFPAGRPADWFTGFAAEETPGRRRVSGLGVGLGLVRAVAEWHGGEVGASCQDGRTTFWIELPASGSRPR